MGDTSMDDTNVIILQTPKDIVKLARCSYDLVFAVKLLENRSAVAKILYQNYRKFRRGKYSIENVGKYDAFVASVAGFTIHADANSRVKEVYLHGIQTDVDFESYIVEYITDPSVFIDSLVEICRDSRVNGLVVIVL